MIVLDTSGLLAAMDSAQRLHEPAKSALEQSEGPLLLSPFVLAELDHLLATKVSRDAELALLDEVARGAYRLEPFAAEDLTRSLAVLERYPDFGSLGLADTSNVVLAERHGTNEILTLDERHFRTLVGPGGRPFRVLPADLGGAG